MITVGLETAAVTQRALLQLAFAVAAAVLELALVAVAVGVAEFALAVEQALAEFADIVLTIAALPFTVAVGLAVLEVPGVPAAIAVVDPPLALQQAVDDLAPVAATIRQHGIGRSQGFALATGSQQQGKAQGGKQVAHGRHPGRRGVGSMPQSSGGEMHTGRHWRPVQVAALRLRSDEAEGQRFGDIGRFR